MFSFAAEVEQKMK